MKIQTMKVLLSRCVEDLILSITDASLLCVARNYLRPGSQRNASWEIAENSSKLKNSGIFNYLVEKMMTFLAVL
jgi:hypothetical protein